MGFFSERGKSKEGGCVRFSERMGLVEVRSALQTDEMSIELRNSLWNVLDRNIWQAKGFLLKSGGMPDMEPFSQVLWSEFFKRPVDERPNGAYNQLQAIRNFYFGAQWSGVYDFVEFCLWLTQVERFKSLPDRINAVLERELSGYRLIEKKFVPVTDENEIEAIEVALQQSPYKGARSHLGQALRLLSNKLDPDYRNSIKESISAVEAACREFTCEPKATLGDALKVIGQQGKMHAALRNGLSAIYGYTSDEGGIRHAMLEEPHLTQADAKYFLVMCSGFVNYLAEKAASGANGEASVG